MSTALKIPSEATAHQAEAALRLLEPVARKKSARAIEVRQQGDEGEVSVTVPKEAFALFLEVLGHMANGNAVTIVPVQAEVTTQQAADLLNVSRPFLIGLLSEGNIPFRLVGTHRRIKVADILDYKRADDERRKTALDELTAEAQRLGLGY